MITEEILHKAIDELAVMVNCSFNVVFNEFREVKQDIKVLKEDVAVLKQDVSDLKISVSKLDTRLGHVEKKIELIDKNMVSRYEFQTLGLRTEALEQALKA